MVPDGWLLTNLEKLMEFKNGLNFTKKDSGELIKIVGVGDFKDFSELVETGHLETVNVSNNIKKDELLESGDLLFVRSNGNKELIGRCLFFPKVNEKLSFSGFTIRGRVYLEKAIPEYIAYFARSSLMKQQISKGGGGTNISNLSQQLLNNIVLLLPPLPEQKKIAQILSTWDKAITTTEKLLANSEQQKKALMQQLLTGKKRFLGFSREWRNGRLGELCDFKGGSAFKEVQQGKNSGDLPFIKVSDMNLKGNEIFIQNANNWVTFEAANQMKAKSFPKWAIVFAKVGAALLLNRRRILQQETIIDNNMMAAIPKKSTDPNFLYQILQLIDFAKLVQEGAVPSINQSDLSAFKIHYPDISEQQKIAIVLFTADREIENIKQKLHCLQQEKKALMQQLLTGKRRVQV